MASDPLPTPLRLVKGRSLRMTVTLRQARTSDTPADQKPPVQDLTGASAKLTLKSTATDASPLLQLTSPSNGLTMGGTAGTVTVLFKKADTASLPLGAFLWDLVIDNGNGVDSDQVLFGPGSVEASIT